MNWIGLLICLMGLTLSQAYNWQEGNDGQVTWASGCDFQSNDIANQPSSDTQCGSLCIANSQCNYFSWGNDVCYMKYSSNNLVATDWEAGMCGYVNSRINNPPPPSGNLFVCYFPNWARYRDSNYQPNYNQQHYEIIKFHYYFRRRCVHYCELEPSNMHSHNIRFRFNRWQFHGGKRL